MDQHYPEPTVGALIELGESIETTLKREIKEETKLDIHDIEFICVQEFVFDDQFWKKKHFIFLDYACKTNSTEVKLDDEGQAYIWVTLEEALKLPIDTYSRTLIKGYMGRK